MQALSIFIINDREGKGERRGLPKGKPSFVQGRPTPIVLGPRPEPVTGRDQTTIIVTPTFVLAASSHRCSFSHSPLLWASDIETETPCSHHSISTILLSLPGGVSDLLVITRVLLLPIGRVLML